MLELENLESKGDAQEMSRVNDDLMEAFEAFQQTNDQRLDQLEAKMSADVLTKEKLERIEMALDANQRMIDDLSVKSQRPPRTVQNSDAGHTSGLQHKAAFETYVRQGEAGTLRRLEAKALSVGSDPDGGYLVPSQTEAQVNTALKDVSPMRAVAGVRQVSGSIYKRPFSTTGADTGWVGETDPRAQTGTPTLAELSFPTMELYAMPAATSALLDDAAVDIDAWLADEVRSAFAEQEGQAFIVGDGVNKPRGFLNYPTVDEASWSFGNVGTISTGVAGAFPASDAGDVLIDLIYALKAGYRANGRFMMNRATQSEVRKMKDADGHYLWQPASGPGQAPSLLGFPVMEAEDMPDIANDAAAIAFGDFSRGYLIVDRVGIRVLRDPYSAKPYVLFYTTKRVGGGIQDFDAIKLLKFAS